MSKEKIKFKLPEDKFTNFQKGVWILADEYNISVSDVVAFMAMIIMGIEKQSDMARLFKDEIYKKIIGENK